MHFTEFSLLLPHQKQILTKRNFINAFDTFFVPAMFTKDVKLSMIIYIDVSLGALESQSKHLYYSVSLS